MTKMTKKEFLKFFEIDIPVIEGNPNEHTHATRKNHVHKIGKSPRPRFPKLIAHPQPKVLGKNINKSIE